MSSRTDKSHASDLKQRESRRAHGVNHTRRPARSSDHTAHLLTDHEEIRAWAESRGARPARVKGTGGGKGDVGMIRLDFPGYSGADTLEPISWDEWFTAFDENNLGLLVQDRTSSGQESHFNKLVSRTGSTAAKETRRKTH